MKNPTVPTIVVASVICLALGAVGGYYARYFAPEKDPTVSSPPPGAGPTMGGMMGGAPGGPGGGKGGPPGGGGGMGGMGGMMGGMGGGGMGGPPAASADLKRVIRSLNTVQRVQDRGLTAAQVQELLPLLKAIQSAEKLPDAECKTKTEEILKILADAQKDTLKEVFPQGGGFGGGGGGGMGGGKGGAPGGAKGGPPAGGGMGGMMGGMGGQKGDPDKPFASERDKKSLEDLIAVLEGKGQK